VPEGCDIDGGPNILAPVRTVVLGPRPAELEALIARRKRLGLDTHDEVWEGEYHVAPEAHLHHAYLDDEVAALLRPLAKRAGLIGTGPFNLGAPDDFRVPDRGLHRSLPPTAWAPTAALVVEILSPDDETFEKFGFYAAHEVDELLVVDGLRRTLELFARRQDRYERTTASALLAVTSEQLAASIDWPPAQPSSK